MTTAVTLGVDRVSDKTFRTLFGVQGNVIEKLVAVSVRLLSLIDAPVSWET